MIISIIVAVAKNGVIGAGNALPWRLGSDLKYFKAKTMDKPVIMGRKTWDSIGRPLPGRRNIVISRNPALAIDGAETVTSLQAALTLVSGAAEVMIIGGAQIYADALPCTDRLYLTEVDLCPDGDTFFPALDHSHWQEVSRTHVAANGENPAHDFVVLERR